MDIKEAAKILGLVGNITPAITKKAYRKSRSLYHPDRNPYGAEKMKTINSAYQVIKDFVGHVGPVKANPEFTQQNDAILNKALNAVMPLLGLKITVTDVCIMVTGNTYQYERTLKSAGFYCTRQGWQFDIVSNQTGSKTHTR